MPTNKVLEITGVDIDKVVDGKIVEHGGSTETYMGSRKMSKYISGNVED